MKDFNQVSHIRRTIEERLQVGASIDAFIDKILVQAPNTLVSLIFHEDPIEHVQFRRKVIASLDALTRHISPREIYLLLAKQSAEDGVELLQLAMQKYLEELWIIDLSKIVEGSRLGYHHTMRKRKDKNFLVWCFRYAWQGAREGLIQMAAETGNPVPAAALLRVGAFEEAITAAHKALEKDPKSPVVECMAATIGPDIEDVLEKVLLRFPKQRTPKPLLSFRKCYPSLG